MRKVILASVAGFFATLCISVSSVAAAPYCGLTWGSGPESSSTTTTSSLTNIRTGRHDCYDRMTFDLSGTGSTGYKVEYVSSVTGIASDKPIHLTGGAKLRIVINARIKSTYKGVEDKTLPGVNLSGYKTFKSAKYGSSFEGKTLVGLGVRSKLPFRVFKSGNHVVVDVAHYW